MKRTFIAFLFLSIFMVVTVSCKRKTNEDQWITKRIQYDVTIKSPDPAMDWWVQNVEGASRETFVNAFISAAYSGDIKAWDVFHNEMSTDQVKAIGNRSDTLTFQRPDPPFDLYDTVIRQELSLNEISRFRFLESWKMDPRTLKITKEVIGVCPLMESYAPDGTMRGYMPMFWVYFDPQYPAAFKVSSP